jgi:hypothetical protein
MELKWLGNALSYTEIAKVQLFALADSNSISSLGYVHLTVSFWYFVILSSKRIFNCCKEDLNPCGGAFQPSMILIDAR